MSGDGFRDSLWSATAAPPPKTPPLSGDVETETVIVGGGFAGLSAALHLAEAGRPAVLVEAEEPGWGASGRNGGQVNPGWKLNPSEIMLRYGPHHGGAVVQLVDQACDVVFDLIKRHRIDCGAVREGLIVGAYIPREAAMLEVKVEEWAALGAKSEMLDDRGMADRLGTDRYVAGMLDPRGGNLNPLSYARGLARAALNAGARIHGGTKAVSVSRVGSDWLLQTTGGTVTAHHLLLCTNGYTDRLWSGLARTVVPVASHQSATAPLSDNVRHSILPYGQHVSEARNAMVYYRLSPDGRFMIGGRSRRPMLNAQTGDTAHIRREALRLFPQLEGAEWDYDWGGYVAMTPEHAPLFLELGKDAYATLAFQGRGVAMATVLGRELAALILGEPTAMPPAPPAGIPFHAFRNFGIAWRVHTSPLRDRL